MRASQLPQPVLARLVELDERLAALATAAHEADAKVAHARSIINGKTDVGPEEFAFMRDNFATIHTAATQARERAEAQRKILAEAKRWVEALPDGSRLLQVAPAAADLDLAALQARLQTMRDELRLLTGTPPVSPDIGRKVDAYVGALAGSALPLVRGFHGGGTLDVRWPMAISGCDRRNGVGFDDLDANPLLLFAALFPGELAALIMKAVREVQPLSQAEHAERRNALEHAIDEISYVVAALLDREGQPPDPLMCSWHHLGVRTADEIEAAAVA